MASHDIPIEDFKSELLRQYENALRSFKKTGEGQELVDKLKAEYVAIEKEPPVKMFKTQTLESTDKHINFAEGFLERWKDDPEISKNMSEAIENLKKYKANL